MAYRTIKDTLNTAQPLKYATGAEQSKPVVIDYMQVAANAHGQRLAYKGEIFTKITATGKYGPYDRTASDGRQTIARHNAVILSEGLDVRLGDVAVGGFFGFCTFDVSELTTHMLRINSVSDVPDSLLDAFPTCEWDD